MCPRPGFAVLLAVFASCSNEPAIHVTAGDVDAQLAELAPPVRQAMQTPARRQQLVDNLVRLEVLARAAESDGLANDPSVRFATKKAMAAKYHERFLQRYRATQPITDADVRQYFEQHRDDFSRPARVRVELLTLSAGAAEARALLTRVLADEQTDPDAFARAARERSDDPITRPLGGDLGLQTREELDGWGAAVAEAAFALEPGHTCDAVLQSPRGFSLLRVTERVEAQTRSLDEVKGQIAARLEAQRADDEFERHVTSLREAAGGL